MFTTSLLLVVRYRLRALGRARWATLVRVALSAVATGPLIALGAIWLAVISAPSPFRDPDSLVVITSAYGKSPAAMNLTFSDVRRLRDNADALATSAAVQALRFGGGKPDMFDYAGTSYPLRLRGARVTPSFFDVVGTTPDIGRTFTASTVTDDVTSVVISHRLWRELFGQTADILGRPLRLGDVSYEVIGVMPTGFSGVETEPIDLWVPWVLQTAEIGAGSQVCCIAVARLKPGVPLADLGQRLSAGLKDRRLSAVPIRVALAASPLAAIRLLTLAAIVVLVLAVLTLIHRQVTRMLVAEHDLSVFRACGARRGHLWLATVAEEWLIAIAAVPPSLLMAVLCLAAVGPLTFIDQTALTLGQWLLGSAAVSLVLSIVTAGGASAIMSRRLVGRVTLRLGGRAPVRQGATRWRRRASIPVAAATALLLVLAAVVSGSALRLNAFTLGFEPADIVVLDTRLVFSRYKTAADVSRFENLALDAVKAVRGVTDASFGGGVPVFAPGRTRVVGGPTMPGRLEFSEYRVEPGFFRLLQIPILQGRAFNTSEPEPVAIMARSCASRFGNNAMGALLPLTKPTRVVGIAGDVVSRVDTWDHCALYVPSTQETTWSVRLLVRVDAPTSDLEGRLRQAIASVAPGQPIDRIGYLDSYVRATLAPRYVIAIAVGGLALVAWLMALSWFQGVVLTAVTERRTEIGVRLAVGGHPRDVAWRLLSSEVRPLALGALLGLLLSVPASELTRHLEFSISTAGMTWAVALAALGGIGIVAGSLPLVCRTVLETPRALLR